MYRRAIAPIGALVLLLAACSSTPKAPNKYGHHYDYSYQAPAQVSESDAEECGRHADAEAFAAASKISDRVGILFGPLGAAVQLARVKSRLNSTYVMVMKACLRGKGYELAE
jgi:hypothetical protein